MRDILLLFAGALISALTTIYLKDKTDVARIWRLLTKTVAGGLPAVIVIVCVYNLWTLQSSMEPATKHDVGFACIQTFNLVAAAFLLLLQFLEFYFDWQKKKEAQLALERQNWEQSK